MQSISTIGLDIAKSVFQVHGVDAVGQVVLRRQLRRRQLLAFFQKLQPYLVGIEACASSHHWSCHPERVTHLILLGGFATGVNKNPNLTLADRERFAAMKTLMKEDRSSLTKYAIF
jgi:hypothetical protein